MYRVFVGFLHSEIPFSVLVFIALVLGPPFGLFDGNSYFYFMYNKTDFIESLVQKDDRLQAIRYIYAFEVAEKFPPVPILKAHLTYSKELAKRIREGKNSKEAAVCSFAFLFLKIYSFRSLKDPIYFHPKFIRFSNFFTE